mmetsp:Transcript_18672/g.61085  ORF Transcript_18672/g.61085 Transcript_18672/m.61085 type:complete len:338 (+) Transcript_18672:228-1241(+)
MQQCLSVGTRFRGAHVACAIARANPSGEARLHDVLGLGGFVPQRFDGIVSQRFDEIARQVLLVVHDLIGRGRREECTIQRLGQRFFRGDPQSARRLHAPRRKLCGLGRPVVGISSEIRLQVRIDGVREHARRARLVLAHELEERFGALHAREIFDRSSTVESRHRLTPEAEGVQTAAARRDAHLAEPRRDPCAGREDERRQNHKRIRAAGPRRCRLRVALSHGHVEDEDAVFSLLRVRDEARVRGLDEARVGVSIRAPELDVPLLVMAHEEPSFSAFIEDCGRPPPLRWHIGPSDLQVVAKQLALTVAAKHSPIPDPHDYGVDKAGLGTTVGSFCPS